MNQTDAANVAAFLNRQVEASIGDGEAVASLARVRDHLTETIRRMNAPAIDDGGPAMPCPDLGAMRFGDPSAYSGMTLRDRFAEKALAAMDLQIQIAEPAASRMAESAYVVADAMLKARKP